MAIYHLSANVISRTRGQSAVAAAAYRCGAKLRDERYGILHDYTRTRGDARSQIMAPEGTPEWALDRETLWNRVESAEHRRDSQLARAIDVALPLELASDQCWELLRDYTAQTFVSQGMIADLCMRLDNPANPQAHILLTLRELAPSGFGPKARRWNAKANLLEWRAEWALRVNEHLARAGYGARIDHRTLLAQQIELTPSRRVGARRSSADGEEAAEQIKERVGEQQCIARDNGLAILEDPTLALRALAHASPIFTHEDIAKFLRSRTDGAAQYEAAYRAITQSDQLVALQATAHGEERLTSRDLIEAAGSLEKRVGAMAARRGHGVASPTHALISGFVPDEAAGTALDYMLAAGDAKALALLAADKCTLLTVARRYWEAAGLQVFAMARSRTAAQALESGCGIRSHSLEHFEHAWAAERELLNRASVLVVDAAEMISLKTLERIVAMADNARAKIVLIGRVDQLAAMKLASPFKDVWLKIGPAMV